MKFAIAKCSEIAADDPSVQRRRRTGRSARRQRARRPGRVRRRSSPPQPVTRRSIHHPSRLLRGDLYTARSCRGRAYLKLWSLEQTRSTTTTCTNAGQLIARRLNGTCRRSNKRRRQIVLVFDRCDRAEICPRASCERPNFHVACNASDVGRVVADANLTAIVHAHAEACVAAATHSCKRDDCLAVNPNGVGARSVDAHSAERCRTTALQKKRAIWCDGVLDQYFADLPR